MRTLVFSIQPLTSDFSADGERLALTRDDEGQYFIGEKPATTVEALRWWAEQEFHKNTEATSGPAAFDLFNDIAGLAESRA